MPTWTKRLCIDIRNLLRRKTSVRVDRAAPAVKAAGVHLATLRAKATVVVMTFMTQLEALLGPLKVRPVAGGGINQALRAETVTGPCS